MDEQMKEHFALLSQQYPKPKPCINCLYWSSASGASHSLPSCDYLLLEGVTRPGIPDLRRGTCPQFRPHVKGKRRPKSICLEGSKMK